jgi:hypothetical protein
LLKLTISFCSSNNFSSDVDVDGLCFDLDWWRQYAWAVDLADQIGAVVGVMSKSMNILMICLRSKLSLDCDEMKIGHWLCMMGHGLK